MKPSRCALVLGLIMLTGCGGSAQSPSATGSISTTGPISATTSPTLAIAPSPSPRPTPAEPTPLPSGLAAFAYDKSQIPQVAEKKREQQGSATVIDLQWVGAWGDTMRAFLVMPAGVGPFPAVVYLHWLASDATASRTEFLDEGIALADKGLASLHVQGRFPWLNSPSGVEADRAGIVGQVTDMRQAIDYLATRPEIDPSRLAIVGHDFGAMYAALLAGLDDRFGAAVIMAGVPHWADWFVKYWRPLGSLSESDYRTRLADLDPAVFVGKVAPRPVFFQWAAQDSFIDVADRDEFTIAAGESATSKVYAVSHKLNDPAATSDRDDWLVQHLLPTGG